MGLFPLQTRKLADFIYKLRDKVESHPVLSDPITIICVSDTHNHQPTLPKGDLLLHAGDLTEKGTFQELQDQIDWLHEQPHKHKIVIAGNHDLLLDPIFVDHFPERIIERPGSCRSDLQWKSVTYLQDQSFAADFANGRKLMIYGSPWTLQFGNWAFQYPQVRDVFNGAIPSDTDILLTHGPPKLHLDSEPGGQYLAKGSRHLLQEIWRVRGSLKLVVFGHIHAGYGTEVIRFDKLQRTYDAIKLGESGLPWVFIMMLLMLWSRLRHFIGLAADKSQGKDVVQVANAAMKADLNEPGPKRPWVFQI